MYMEDTLKTSQSYVHLLKQKDSMEDQALALATDNIKQAEILESDLMIYNDTVHPHYDEQKEKATQLLE